MKETDFQDTAVRPGRFRRMAPWLCLLHAVVVWGWIELHMKHGGFPFFFFPWWLLYVAWFAWGYVFFRQRWDVRFLLAFLLGLVVVLSELFFAVVVPLWRFGGFVP